MEPREGREEEERGSAGGRRGEAHNAMGHGGWTDSICSRLSVALVMDGELGRDTERAGRRERRKKRERERGREEREGIELGEGTEKGAGKSNFGVFCHYFDERTRCVEGRAARFITF